jgi:hypothetical protein
MRRVEDMTTPLNMSGVGGNVWARQQVEIYIPALQCKIMMYLVKGTAPIISIGKLVREQGYRYVWSPEREPYFELPNGKIVECSTAVDVPYVAAAVGNTQSSAPSTPVRNAGGDLSPTASPESQFVVSPQCSISALSQAGSQAPASDVHQAVVAIDPMVVEQAESQRRRKRRQDQAKAAHFGEPLEAIEVIQQPGESRQQARRRRARENHGRSTVVPHNLFTHFPKDPKCEICQQAKPQRAQCRRQTSKSDDHESHSVIEAKVFADALTADHAISDKDNKSRHGSTVACVIVDRATGWLQSYPCQTKSIADTKRSFQRYLGPVVKPKNV